MEFILYIFIFGFIALVIAGVIAVLLHVIQDITFKK